MKHEMFEKNSILLVIGTLILISIGGIVQLVPLFFLESTIEKVEGMRPYSPLELAGRNIYVREGCYVCHSQMIRPLRDEAERYGHYSLAAESMYDRPFQWGSKRTGPDLARVGGKYSNDWHAAHMIDPQSIVPESVMPQYPFLAARALDYGDIADHLSVLQTLGTPYTDEMITNAVADVKAQAQGDLDEAEAVTMRYPKAQSADFDGNPDLISELDALIAYLQMLGTLVDFETYRPAS